MHSAEPRLRAVMHSAEFFAKFFKSLLFQLLLLPLKLYSKKTAISDLAYPMAVK
jgi:hypothetical protein